MTRGMVWGMRARRRVTRALEAGRGARLEVPHSGRIGAGGLRGVRLVLRMFGDRCLVDALVRQQWHAAHGSKRALMIGVTAPSAGFTARAWLEGDPPSSPIGLAEPAHRPASQD